jgi:MFS family permease
VRSGQNGPVRTTHATGFWIVALVFLTVMAYSTVPTPLYPLNQAHDDFAVWVVTVIFAVYAVGVMAALYTLGHVSDWLGRRRILVIATLVAALSAVVFVCFPEVGGLVVARFVNGVSVGMVTATATAHLAELRAVAMPGESSVLAASAAVVANLGGLALGPLIGGVFAEFLPAPLVLPHVVFFAALVAGALALTRVPETVTASATHVRYRPQRLFVPAPARTAFGIAAFGAFAAFAVFGLFTSLAPTFLRATFDAPDLLLAGATVFAVFAAAATGQLLVARFAARTQLTIAMVGCSAGLVGVAAGAVAGALAVFVGGGIVAGFGVGVLFKATIASVGALADPQRRGETLALYFLIAYAGLIIPVLAVGAALSVAAPVAVLLVFAALVLAATVWAGLAMRARVAGS